MFETYYHLYTDHTGLSAAHITKVSRKYLPLYVIEFQFRYNNRLNADIFGETIRGC